MKHTKPFFTMLLLACIAITGCNFSKGTKKDLATGLSYNYNGFRIEDIVLVDPANQRMTDKKVQLNTKIAIVATGLENYGLKDGKAFPGMMLLVTDKKGTPILKAADLFEGDQGHVPDEASLLRGSITIANPMTAGETYHVKMRIWDKITPENEVNIETDLVVQ